MSDLQQILAAIAASEAGTKAEIAGVGRNVTKLEQTVGSVVGTVQALASKCERQEESLTNLHEKFVRLETELEATRNVVAVMKTQGSSFSPVVSRRQEVLTGANRQEQELGAGLDARIMEPRRFVQKRSQEQESRQDRGNQLEEQDIDVADKSKTDLNKARKTLGFGLIRPEDSGRQFKDCSLFGKAEKKSDAKVMAVLELMLLDMKISNEEQKDMEILRVFATRRENAQMLYCEFGNISSVHRV